MKYLKALLLLVVSVMVYSQAQANLTVQNNTGCTYSVRVIVADLGSCSGALTNAWVTVPAFGSVTITCPAGKVAIAAQLLETSPGLNQLVTVGDSFCNYNSGVNTYGNCNATIRFLVGSATNFVTIN